jgi:hypothetical protein
MDCTSAPVDHFVWFYEERAHLIEQVAAYAADGLRAGESVVLVATADHLVDIAKHLDTMSVDTTRLATYDAAATLHRFYRDGAIDREAFNATIGTLVKTAAAGNRVRIFGEMVALLWEDGAVHAAVQLEALWCQLREEVGFQLMCAYPSGLMLDEHLHAPANAVCELHSEIYLGETGEASSAMRVYPPTPRAVGEARRFARACLGGDSPGIDDIMLVVSELASNAVRHAHTAFAVHVSVLGDTVRVGVRDADAANPRLLPMMMGMAETGRGIATVAAIGIRWGIDTHATGKTVWAELPL